MSTSRPKRKTANTVVTRSTDELSREVCAYLKELYYDMTKGAYKKTVRDMIKLYEEERHVEINCEEYIAELRHRVLAFFDRSNCVEGQIRVLRAVTLFACKVYIDFNDRKVLNAIVDCIHLKKFDSLEFVRCLVVRMIGWIFDYTMSYPQDANDYDTAFASFLPKKIFNELFDVLSHMASDKDEGTRKYVVLAMKEIQNFPAMTNVDGVLTAKQLIILGIRDSSEAVRIAGVVTLNPKDYMEARLLLNVLVQESSHLVRIEAANRVSQKMCLSDFAKPDVSTLFKDKSVFLGDEIIPEFYDILFRWICDAYRIARDFDHDCKTQLSPQQIARGCVEFLDYLRHGKEWLMVYIRLFEHIRRKLFADNRDEGSYVEFAKMFEAADSFMINSRNFEEFLLFADGSRIDGEGKLRSKLNKVFVWCVLCNYCCLVPSNAGIRSECRALLMPTLKEGVLFVGEVWTQLVTDGTPPNGERPSSWVPHLQNSCAKYLLKVIPLFERDEIGMREWKAFLYNILAGDNEFRTFELESELYQILVHDYLYYHFDVKKDPENAIFAISDLVYHITGDNDSRNDTQDLLIDATQEVDTDQNPGTSDAPLTDVDPERVNRAVFILEAVVKVGMFKEQNTVLEGLVTTFVMAAFDNPGSVQFKARRSAFICFAGMAPLVDLSKNNYIKRARTILDSSSEHVEIKKLALMMVCDSILSNGYERTVQLYFDDFLSRLEDHPYELSKRIIEFVHDQELTNLAIRILLRLILFDYRRRFQDGCIYLLRTVFSPSVDVKLRKVIAEFFMEYCSVNQEHQCFLAESYSKCLLSLKDCDLGNDSPQVNKELMEEFILDVTSFSALRLDAVNRFRGSAHFTLARRLIVDLENVTDDNDFAEIFADTISKCEVSEVAYHELLEKLNKACQRFINMVFPSARVKRLVEQYGKRIASITKYIYTKNVPPVKDPGHSKSEMEAKVRTILKKIELLGSEENWKKPWLTEPVEECAPEDVVLPKIKIIAERAFDRSYLLNQVIECESSVSAGRAPASGKRSAKVAAANTPQKVASIPLDDSCTPKLRSSTRAKRNALQVVVEEDEMPVRSDTDDEFPA